MERIEINKYIQDHIRDFHRSRLESLKQLKLQKILTRKNPYLFKAKNTLTAQDIVKGILDAHLSSQEETLFGKFLEGLAIFICTKVYNGKKSAAEGIDLEFKKQDVYYVVSIKSGPNWGNSQQVRKMKDAFKKAKIILRENNKKLNVVAVNGCCYGRDDQPDKGEYYKYCGQRFWEFISGDKNLYLDIIEPLGHKAKERNQEFYESYAKAINEFTLIFAKDFCSDGEVDWEKLVKFSSSIRK